MLTIKKYILVHNFFSVGIIQALIALLQLLVIPYTIKMIGVDGFGVVAVAQVVMLYLSGLVDYGFNQAATREVALSRSDRTALSRVLFKVLFTKLVLCLFAFFLLIVLLLAVPVFRLHTVLYLAAFLFVIGQASLLTWFFQGLEKMRFIALLTLAGRIVFVALVFAFLKDRQQDYYFLFFLGAGTLIAGLASVLFAWRIVKFEFVKPSWKEIACELRDGWHFTVANLSGYTCQYANIFILRIFTNDLVAGYYSIAERIFFATRQVLVVFSQVIYPGVCQLIQRKQNQLLQFFAQIYLPFLLLISSACLLVGILSPQILYFFSGNEPGNSVFLLRVMCLVTVIICMNIPANLFLMASNYKRAYLKITLMGTLLNLAANIILVQFLDAKGTVLAVLCTELFITIGLWWNAYGLYVHNRSESMGFKQSISYKPNS